MHANASVVSNTDYFEEGYARVELDIYRVRPLANRMKVTIETSMAGR
jgi:hypothetical protein